MTPDDGSPKTDFLVGADLGFSFKDIVDWASDIVVVTKAYPLTPPGPIIVYVNEAFTRISGYAAHEMLGGNPRRLQSVEADPATKRRIRQALEAQQPVRATLPNVRKDGRPYWVELNIVPLRDSAGRVTHFAAIERDITEQKRLEAELTELARTDALTGLLNRRAFLDLAEAEISRLRRNQRGMAALLMFDIDHFKAINDSFGHTAGDLVLRELGAHCRQSLRAHDVVGRIGGEEFAVLLPEMTPEGAREMADRLRRGLAQLAIHADGVLLRFTVSIGLVELRPSPISLQEQLARADTALYEAKHQGRNRVVRALDLPTPGLAKAISDGTAAPENR